MRVKLSKLLPAVLAICIVFVGFTAFAAEVVTTTNYNYDDNYITNNDGSDGIPAKATMTVTTTVTGVKEGTEVTYLVSDGTASSDIVYINQDTADENGVTFTFNADQGRLFSCTAKYGSNATLTMPTFKFNHGVNFMSNGTANVSGLTADSYSDGEDEGTLFLGKVGGEVVEYGIQTKDGTKFPAMGCDNAGNFAVLISGINTTDATSYVVTRK